jgi:SAM-dependent methyltransferase
MLKSSICRKQDLIDFEVFAKVIGPVPNPFRPEICSLMHRKAWEFVFIAQALFERGMLQSGKKGLGFAVGKEPLPALFAKYGCQLDATDLDSSSEAAKTWTNIELHSDSLSDLYKPDICEKNTFDKNVTFKFLDMNNIPGDCGGFDFCWSSCAFEHLGSVQNGKQFIYNMMKCLKPGGIAVHTTEYNISSIQSALDHTDAVLFGREDLLEMRDTLLAQGHHVEELDFRLGDSAEENFVAYPPYDRSFFKLYLYGHIVTSFALIIKKAE